MNTRRVLFTLVLVVIVCGQQPLASQPSRQELQQTARQLFFEGRYRQVIDTLRSVVPDSLSPQTLFCLGSAHGALQNLRLSLKFLEQAANRDSTAVNYRHQYARSLHQAGMVLHAQRQYGLILERDSLHVPALTGLGQILTDQRRYSQAAGLLQKALRQNPRDYLSLYALGLCLVNLGKPDSGQVYLAASQTLNPAYVPGTTLLASLHYKKSNFEEALRLYELAAERAPFLADVRYRAALCHLKLNEKGAALAHFREAAGLDTASVLYLAHLGQLYYERNQFDSSAVVFRRAVQLDEDTPSLWLNLGLSYAHLDSPKAAIQAFRSCITASQPENIGRAYKEIGTILLNDGNAKGAGSSYARALQLIPEDLNARFFYALALDQMGRHGEALAGYRRFLQKAEQDRRQRRNVKFARSRMDELRAAERSVARQGSGAGGARGQ